jgi:putative transposase
MLNLITANREESQVVTSLLDNIAKEGARRMLLQALDQEVAEYIQRHQEDRSEDGKALVVRNGKGRPRKITVGSGTLEVKAPRVNDRREDKQFTSKILPPYMRKSPNVESLLPILYLKGLSTNNFKTALTCLLGEGASGLSASAITSLKKSWESEFEEWKNEAIKDRFVYLWADGVNVKVRLGEDKKLCLLVIIGVNERGEKKLLAVEPGYRESKDSWSFVLRDLMKRGLTDPLLAIGDGALGFWAAVGDVMPQIKQQRCWFHKMGNVLNELPKRLQAKATDMMREMMRANCSTDAGAALKDFKAIFGAKHGKAVHLLEKDWKELTAYFKFPAKHWQSIRTTNPIESTFATVKLRTKVTKGAGSPKAASTMAFKLMKEAEKMWRKLRGYKEIDLLLSGVEYKDGIVITKEPHQAAVA